MIFGANRQLKQELFKEKAMVLCNSILQRLVLGRGMGDAFPISSLSTHPLSSTKAINWPRRWKVSSWTTGSGLGDIVLIV